MKLADTFSAPEVASSIAVAGTAHDLGNLMQIAASAINIVARTPDMPAIHSRPILARATASLEQAAAIVRQTISRARDSAVILEDTDVSAGLAEVATLIASMDGPGFLLDVAVESELPMVRCDPIGLRRAILNLVFNARDALVRDGVVQIEAQRKSRSSPGPEIEIRVADNGIGMSAETIARVFDPFFTTKRDGLGGVGLPMVERFAREAGGEVSIESEPGVGTTVILRLPAILRAVGGNMPAQPPKTSAESM